MRMPLIAGNWKMHRLAAGTTSFFESFRPLVECSRPCDIVICPSFLDLEAAVAAAQGMSIQIGAQNLCCAREGPGVWRPWSLDNYRSRAPLS